MVTSSRSMTGHSRYAGSTFAPESQHLSLIQLQRVITPLVEDYNLGDKSEDIQIRIRRLVHIRAISFEHMLASTFQVFGKSTTYGLGKEAIAIRNRRIGDDPFGLMATNLGEAWDERIGELVRFRDKHDWSARLHHRLLVYYSIVCYFYRKGDAHLSI